MGRLILLIFILIPMGCDLQDETTPVNVPPSVEPSIKEEKPVAIFPQHKFALDEFSVLPPKTLIGESALHYKLPYAYTPDDTAIIIDTEFTQETESAKRISSDEKLTFSRLLLDRMTDDQITAMAKAYQYGCLKIESNNINLWTLYIANSGTEREQIEQVYAYFLRTNNWPYPIKAYYPIIASLGVNDSVSLITIDATRHAIKPSTRWINNLRSTGRSAEVVEYKRITKNFTLFPAAIPANYSSKVHLHRIVCAFPNTSPIKHYVKAVNEHIVISKGGATSPACPKISILQSVWSDKKWPSDNFGFRVKPYTKELSLCKDFDIPPAVFTPVLADTPFIDFNYLTNDFIEYLTLDAQVVDNLYTNFVRFSPYVSGAALLVVIIAAAPAAVVTTLAFVFSATTITAPSQEDLDDYNIVLYPESADTGYFTVYENDDITNLILPIIDQITDNETAPNTDNVGLTGAEEIDPPLEPSPTLPHEPVAPEPVVPEPVVPEPVAPEPVAPEPVVPEPVVPEPVAPEPVVPEPVVPEPVVVQPIPPTVVAPDEIQILSFTSNQSSYFPGEDITLCYSLSIKGQFGISLITQNLIYLNTTPFSANEQQTESLCVTSKAPLILGDYTIELRETSNTQYGLMTQLTVTVISPPVPNNPPVIIQENRSVLKNEFLVFRACQDADNDRLIVKLVDDNFEVDGISNADYKVKVLDSEQCLIRIKKRVRGSVTFKLRVSDGVDTVTETINIDEAYKNLGVWNVTPIDDQWLLGETGNFSSNGLNLDILSISSNNDRIWMNIYNNDVDISGSLDVSDYKDFANGQQESIVYLDSLDVHRDIATASVYLGSKGDSSCGVSSYEVHVQRNETAHWEFYDNEMGLAISNLEIIRRLVNTTSALLNDNANTSKIYGYDVKGLALDIDTTNLNRSVYMFRIKVDRGPSDGCIYRLRLHID